MENVHSEQLEKPLEHHDYRFIEHYKNPPTRIPRYNRLYDSLRTEQAWRYISDAYATGTFTTIAGTAVSTAILLAQTPNWRMKQWPGGVQLYYVIRFFSLAPQSAISTPGSIDVLLIDRYGNVVPLGDYVSDAAASNSLMTLIPSSIVDTGNSSVGNLIATLSGTSPTTSVYNYQLGFSVAYLMPTERNYEEKSSGD